MKCRNALFLYVSEDLRLFSILKKTEGNRIIGKRVNGCDRNNGWKKMANCHTACGSAGKPIITDVKTELMMRQEAMEMKYYHTTQKTVLKDLAEGVTT